MLDKNMPKVVKYSDTSWKVIKDPEEIKQLKAIIAEYQLWEPTDTNVYLVFGYKNISTGEKETYYLLRDLASISFKKNGQAKCKVSLQYLAIALGTSEECQRLRVNKLKAGELILSKYLEPYTANIYYINMEPLPDTTFADTIHKLAIRKQVNNLYQTISHTNNIEEKIDCLEQIKELDPEGLFRRKSIAHLVEDTDIPAETIINHCSQNNLFTH